MSAEEKELPASARKLQQARQEGQVAHSKDLGSAITLIAAVVYLINALGTLVTKMQAILSIPTDFHDAAIKTALVKTVDALIPLALDFLAPLFVATIVAAILASMLVQKGFIVSFAPLTPKFDRLNPVQGFTNMFNLNKLVELIKALIKLAVLGSGGFFVVKGFINQLMWVPTCGLGCAGLAWTELVKLLTGLTIIVFLINGVIDMRVQLWLFLRGQRMTKTERKQEQKNQNQSPEIKRAMRKQARAARAESKGGLQSATMVLGDRSMVIGIRFVRNETPAPLCVCKARGTAAKKMIREADKLNIPVHFDTTFCEALFNHATPSSFLPSSSYTTLAQIFKELNLL